LQRDHLAHEEAARSWQQFTTERGGDAGVASAMSGLALKSANVPAQASLGAEASFARRYGLASSSSVPAAGMPEPTQGRAQFSQQAQFVAGKNFFQNGNQWIDSATQKAANLSHVRVQFGSAEYFDLLAKNPQIAPWLALGQNVQFVWSGAVYEVYE